VPESRLQVTFLHHGRACFYLTLFQEKRPTKTLPTKWSQLIAEMLNLLHIPHNTKEKRVPNTLWLQWLGTRRLRFLPIEVQSDLPYYYAVPQLFKHRFSKLLSFLVRSASSFMYAPAKPDRPMAMVAPKPDHITQN